MDSKTSKTLAHEQFERVWNRGDETAVDELYTADCVLHDPMIPVALQGRAAVRTLVQAYRLAFPNLAFTVEDQVAEADRVVTRWTARGTHLRPLLGIPATGRQVEVTGSSFARVEGSRIAETWVHWDRTALFKQLGVVREPAEPAALAGDRG
jgi:steroid delta-isomerase-like uncharacterized protein